MSFVNRGRGPAGWDPNLGRVRALIQNGRILRGSLMNLASLLLGSRLETCRFFLCRRLPQVMPILQWRWRCLAIRAALHSRVMRELLLSLVGQSFRCTARFTLLRLVMTLPRLLTAVTIGPE